MQACTRTQARASRTSPRARRALARSLLGGDSCAVRRAGGRADRRAAADFFVEAFFLRRRGACGDAERPRLVSRLGGEQARDFEKRYGGGDGELFVAVDADGELMGCVGINLARLAAPEGASGGEGPFAIVANLAVDPSRRRKGLAKRLMAEAEQFVREELGEDDAVLLVDASNTPARRLYERLGYKRRWADANAKTLSVRDGTVTSDSVKNLCMRKNVGGGPAALLENLQWQQVAALAAVIAAVIERETLASKAVEFASATGDETLLSLARLVGCVVCMSLV